MWVGFSIILTFGALRSEFPSRIGFTAEPKIFEYFALIAVSASFCGSSGKFGKLYP
jgi:hypothetical protein